MVVQYTAQGLRQGRGAEALSWSGVLVPIPLGMRGPIPLEESGKQPQR